jgi:hypothetical protein
MSLVARAPNNMLNDLIQSKLDEIISTHSEDGKIEVEKLMKLCSINTNEIIKVLNSNNRTGNKLKRPQSGYFLFLNDSRSQITDTLNSERKDEWLKENSIDEWLKENDIDSIDSITEGDKPWTLKGKDKVTLVTKRAGDMWKNHMSDEEKQPYIERAATLKQEYDMKKQDMSNNTINDEPDTPKVKRGRGRPKGSKNKKNISNDVSKSKESSPVPPEPTKENTEESVVKVTKFDYQGKTYLLDSGTGDVYDVDTQDEVGNYDGSTITYN